MAKTVTTLLQVTVSGDGFGGSSPTYQSISQNFAGLAPGQLVTVNGNNTIAIPAAAQGLTIVPPPGSVLTKTLKGMGGDTGFLLHPTLPTSLAFTPGAVASIVLNVNGIETLELIWQ